MEQTFWRLTFSKNRSLPEQHTVSFTRIWLLFVAPGSRPVVVFVLSSFKKALAVLEEQIILRGGGAYRFDRGLI